MPSFGRSQDCKINQRAMKSRTTRMSIFFNQYSGGRRRAANATLPRGCRERGPASPSGMVKPLGLEARVGLSSPMKLFRKKPDEIDLTGKEIPMRVTRSRITLTSICAVSLFLSNTLTAGGAESIESPPPSVSDDVVMDAKTGLMWTRRDNGSHIDWPSANRHCENLKLEGNSDWSLPTIDELEALHDPVVEARYKIRSPFTLNRCCMWSSSKQGPDRAWFFYFGMGRRSHLHLAYSYRHGALCVRRPGE